MHRCSWVNDDPLYIDYHDHEWGGENLFMMIKNCMKCFY